MVRDTYLVTEKQFIMMAAMAGIESVYGFQLNVQELTREDAIYTLQDMRQTGLLKPTEKFELTDDLAALFQVIHHCSTSMEVHKDSGRTCILYVDEVTVLMTKSLRRKDTYEMRMMENREVWNTLMEEGWIPKGGKADDNG